MADGVPKVGDRVRMVQTTSAGVVAGEPYASEVDGGLRIPVRWDGSGKVTGWHPTFLRPADSDQAADPDEVRQGDLVRRRSRITFNLDGVTVVRPEGFARVGG